MSNKIKRVCYKVFEGCEIIYIEINGASSLVRSEENTMYINYCREGSMFALKGVLDSHIAQGG